LFGAGEALREEVGASVLSFYRADYDRGVAAVRAGLGAPAFERAWAEGRALTWEQAIELALNASAGSQVEKTRRDRRRIRSSRRSYSSVMKPSA
jgi:hypothetical protein